MASFQVCPARDEARAFGIEPGEGFYGSSEVLCCPPLYIRGGRGSFVLKYRTTTPISFRRSPLLRKEGTKHHLNRREFDFKDRSRTIFLIE